MSERLRPNFTPIPNVILDQIMPTLAPGATKVLFALCRYTYGWGKPEGDRVSLKQLEEITGMARGSVVRSLKELGAIVVATPGNPSRQLASHYRINVEISDDELVSLRDQSLVSKSDQASLLASRIKRPSKDNPKKEDIAFAPKAHAANGPTAPVGRSKRGEDSPAGFREAMASYHDLFVAKFGATPDIDGGRDGKLLSGLVMSHGAEQVIDLLGRFFESPPKWVEKDCKFTIPAFKNAYTEILAQSRNGKMQMGVL